jgi:hypothetical protein
MEVTMANEPLNLTPPRGPSVWAHQQHRRTSEVWWPATIITVGALMARMALRARGRHRHWLTGLGLTAALGMFLQGCRQRAETNRREGALDDLVESSFPASDPPPLR